MALIRQTSEAAAQENPSESTYKILSIDGGGLRGIIPLVILDRLEQLMPGWMRHINMFAGTSTGGLIALGLAKGMKPIEILDVYSNFGSAIFNHGLWQEIRSLDDMIGPKYDSANRENICRLLLGDHQQLKDYLSEDQQKGHILITAFDLNDKVQADANNRHWKAKIFHNLPTINPVDQDGEELAYRVAMRTSAAPTYFASYDGFVDGGVFANNPSMCAIAQTQDPRLINRIPVSRIRMLSLGTGYSPSFINGEERWGLAQWAPRLVDVLTEGVNEVVDFQARQILGAKHYQRLTARLNQQITLDDVSKIGILQSIGEAVDIKNAIALISEW